jgi:ATP-dependent Clp protease ATP-binding subunit ClpA
VRRLRAGVDEVVVLQRLNRDDLKRLIETTLRALRGRLQQHQVTFELSDAATTSLVERGYDKVDGVRPLARLIQQEITQPLSHRAAAGDLRPGDHVVGAVSGRGVGTPLVMQVRRGAAGVAPLAARVSRGADDDVPA